MSDTPLPRRPALRVGGLSLPVRPRALIVCLALLAACALLALAGLSLGTLRLAPADVLRALAGTGGPDLHLVVMEWRLPRIAGGLLVGLALGLAGALFQTLLRNPLGSPDVIGFDAGSFTGALLVLLAGGGPVLMAAAAFAGGLLAGGLVYGCAGPGHAQPGKLVLIGIAVGALFTALNDWIIMTVRLDAAVAAASWKLGTLAGMDAGRLALGAMLLAGILPLVLAAARAVRALELGPDKAQALGLRVGRAQLALAGLGLLLTAIATLLAGPIGFVALIAPQVARRLSGGPGLPLLASGLTGAVFLMGSDLLARTAFAPRVLPVGAVTAAVGGLYFAAFLRARLRGERG
ncbi:iron-enterobactin transporter permease [Azorhizobium oxalatiphilum]|uniref:Iron-enterobactin transporter permease n=1 Tax=Azorhizobium oxalatiphilum TaxID=980631 RepID=A0A917F7T0_9HYPH|nr:iron chelate uptake ABC transporter family permease subunit [Azorhizobium oxalatiphilum]GGF54041.1 iron-enterobactin transporter permease [Azorhizobium oxalatiphilum]